MASLPIGGDDSFPSPVERLFIARHRASSSIFRLL
jgi:hypothetical protein